MEIISSSAELSAKILKYKQAGQTVGFVPTMGALHAGHISLVEQARRENSFVVVSIFVNPTQFGPNEDFQKYPCTFDADKALLETAGTDLLFYPEVTDIYPENNPVRQVKADPALTQVACGQSRPGHFDGVVTVVARLFDIVQSDKAYFGLKDYQQFLVIKKMAEDLNYLIKIIGCPIIREPDGLAMSSRNSYLWPEERKAALVISKTLRLADKLSRKETSIGNIKNKLLKSITAEPLAKLDYLEILDRDNLKTLKNMNPGNTILLLAVYIGKTRLIDNCFI